MTEGNIRTIVHEFIRKNFLFDDHRALNDEESILSTGVVDSTGVLELITFLEGEFHIRFDDNELVRDNFDTVARIASFVSTKMAGGGAA